MNYHESGILRVQAKMINGDAGNLHKCEKHSSSSSLCCFHMSSDFCTGISNCVMEEMVGKIIKLIGIAKELFLGRLCMSPSVV
jgi:hypothetical protein